MFSSQILSSLDNNSENTEIEDNGVLINDSEGSSTQEDDVPDNVPSVDDVDTDNVESVNDDKFTKKSGKNICVFK